jgi:hypothetical protein
VWLEGCATSLIGGQTSASFPLAKESFPTIRQYQVAKAIVAVAKQWSNQPHQRTTCSSLV